MKKPVRALRKHTSGAVALIFATAVVPICMLTGLVIDFGFVIEAKTKLDLAADAAAFAALRVAASEYAAGDTITQIRTDANAAAQQWWTAQVGTIPDVTSATLNANVLQGTGPTFTATVNYSAQTYEFMPLIFGGTNPKSGAQNAVVSNESVATIKTNQYSTLYFLLDNTSSMMLPATDADLATLQKALYTNLQSVALQASVIAGAEGLVGYNASTTKSLNIAYQPPPGYLQAQPGFTIPGSSKNNASAYCAFACHWSATGQDYYAIARSVGEKLRFDEVQSATLYGIQEMAQREAVLGQLAVGVFTFGGPAMTSSNYLQTVYAEKPIDSVVNGVLEPGQGAIDAETKLKSITPNLTGDTPNTDIGAALNYMFAVTGPSGTGNSASSPIKSVLLITDGVEDDNTVAQIIPSTEGPINPDVCNALKTAGYQVYVLYTPYTAEPVYLPNNINLLPYISGNPSPVLNALQACSSGQGDLIVATSQAAIQDGVATLVEKAIGNTTRVTD